MTKTSASEPNQPSQPRRTPRPEIVIIGPGKVGMTLAILARANRYKIAAVGARVLERATAAAKAIGPEVPAGTPDQAAALGQLVLLTVSDDAIEPLCSDLAAAGAFARGSVVAHCSGALSSAILAPAREICGAAIGSMHPLQTFPDVDAGVKRFPGTYCFCEGDDPAVALLENLANDLGGKAVRMKTEGKLLYHASAVFASNYMVGLIDAAVRSAELAGIGRDQALAALSPLLRATIDNVMRLGPAQALTGPIARGDDKLVARQFADVSAADTLLGEIYSVLGRQTALVARKKGTIDDAKVELLRKILLRE